MKQHASGLIFDKASCIGVSKIIQFVRTVSVILERSNEITAHIWWISDLAHSECIKKKNPGLFA